MKLKNTSDKIIHVGTNIILPGQEISIAKSATETPSMRTLANFNLISLTDEPEAKVVKEPEAKDEQEVEKVEESEESVVEEKPKATRGKRASK